MKAHLIVLAAALALATATVHDKKSKTDATHDRKGGLGAPHLLRADNIAGADLLYLFDRPPEPVFTLRGVNRDVAYDVPEEYLVRARVRILLPPIHLFWFFALF